MRAPSAALALLAAAAAAGAVEWHERPIPPAAAGSESTLWYRCYLQVPERLVNPEGTERDLWRSSMVLAVADLPGAFDIYLNGQSIVSHDGLAEGEERRFKVPPGILQKGAFNALVFRIEGDAAKRGMTAAPVFLDYFYELTFDRPWGVAAEQPEDAELSAIAEKPPFAAYTPGDFRLSSRALAPTATPIPGKRVAPDAALKLLATDDDLAVDALLSEPQVAQPTHLSFDTRGRMWVAQYRQYPYPAGVKMIARDQYYRSKYDRIPPAPPKHDRGADIISVHEDTDGDGVYETSKIVLEGLNMANAALSGWGGIWVMHTPYLLFYPDADGDDIPDADPEVRLAGFGLEDTHSVANGLAWGPDGWLYGGQGSTTTSRVTRPGTDPPDAPGIYNEGPIVWRYHPKTREFEVFADGGGNTFGLSFDAEGRLFSGHNGGNTRGFHFIQEGQFLKQGKNPGKFGPPPNPFAFGELSMMKSTNPIPRFSHFTIAVDAVAMPERLQGKLLSVDPIHHKIVASERAHLGSTFQTTDIGFPLRTDDKTFRPVYLANSPCGGVVIADFREEYIAHGQNYQGQIDPDSGRIYRLRGKESPLVKDRDLESKTSAELVALLAHDNLWHRQTAARLLGQRADPEAVKLLQPMLTQSDTHPALEALWALHQMGKLDETTASVALAHPSPMVRAWVIRLLGDARELPASFFGQLTSAASAKSDTEVRCQILSTAKRLPAEEALALVESMQFPESDVEDPFIPLMAWFVIEAHCADNRDLVLAFFEHDELWSRPVIKQHIVPRLMRRFAEAGSRTDLDTCAQLLELAPTDEAKASLIAGFEQAFAGRALPDLPDELVAKLGKTSLSTRIRGGDPEAIKEGLRLLGDAKADAAGRLAATRAFGTKPNANAVAPLLAIAADGASASDELRRAAFVSLQIYDTPEIGTQLAKAYPALPAKLQPGARNLLASRARWAIDLIEAHAAGSAPASDFDPDLLARLALHSDERVQALLAKHFPAADKPPPAARADAIRAVLKERPGDRYRGEPLFMARCASCHKLFFKGGQIGPDLTAYQRDDLSTMLVSIVDPNAEIREGYENVLVTTKDGRVLSGFLADEDANTVVLRGFDGADIAIPRESIKTTQAAGRSLMPEGLLNGLTDTELRDLFAYLRISQPISQ